MSLPPRDSVAPADLLAYALIEWQRCEYLHCPTCGEVGLVGFSRHRAVAYACQKCGPISPPPPATITVK